MRDFYYKILTIFQIYFMPNLKTRRRTGHICLGQPEGRLTVLTQAVYADGTAVNTGAIAEAKRNLRKPLQWLICFKHCNELPLCHVFDKLDGGFGTSGPTFFKGEHDQEVAGDVHKTEVIKFEKIDSTLRDISGSLSSDQKLLYRYAKEIMRATVPDNLNDQKPWPSLTMLKQEMMILLKHLMVK
jgi:hypothetical protein